MSRFSLIAAVALVAAVALASPDVNLALDGKLNLTDADSNFAFRYTSSVLVDGSLLNTACKLVYPTCEVPSRFYTWSSASVKAEKADKYKGTLDSMIAAAFPPTSQTFPFVVLAYGTGKDSLSADMSSWIMGVVSGQGTGSFKGGIIAMGALSLEEYTPDGKYVDDTLILLTSNDCNPKELGSSVTKGMSCVSSLDNAAHKNNCKVTVTYVTSDNAGILKYGMTPVSPRSIDMIIEVERFKLTNSKNHVRLNLGFVTASGDFEYEGNAKVIKKDGEKVYVAASSYVMVGSKRSEVKVKLESGSIPDSLKDSFELISDVVFSKNLDVSIAHVDFPAGATDFVYDPAAGSGANVYKAGASTVTLSLLVLLVCSLLFLF